MASESKIQEIFDEFIKHWQSEIDSESGKSPSKWFDYRKFMELLEKEVKALDADIFEGYTNSGEKDSDKPSPEYLTARRNELSFIIGALSGIRRRYVAGEDSKCFCELDTNRYSMYSLTSRLLMVKKFKSYSQTIKE